jgi:ABC-type Na+ efflux pump permease subunit
MGGSGVGEEFRLRTLEFLLTRPRRRRSFVWVGWSVGLGLLLVMITSTVLLTFGLLATLTRQIHSWRIFLLVPGLFVGCAVLWTLAYFLTLVLRNGQNGTNWAIFLFLVYFGVSVYLFTEFRVELPSLFAIVGFVVTGKGAFLLNWGGWLTFAAALTPVGQFLFSRAEV